MLETVVGLVVCYVIAVVDIEFGVVVVFDSCC